MVDPFEQLLGPFDPLLAESNLFHELRLPAVEAVKGLVRESPFSSIQSQWKML